MQVTKFVHSCLFIEKGDTRILIDPGKFSWDSRLLNPNKLGGLDFIVITHEHTDHYHEPFLKHLSDNFPHAVVLTNNDLCKTISALGLPNPIRAGSEDNITVFEAAHEPLPLDLPNVLNIGVHIGNDLTHPGDSYEFDHTRAVLALPITGPFASLRQSLKTVVRLRPKVVLPVHDWEWHKSARETRYDMCKKLLTPHGIGFVEPENGVPMAFS